MMKIQKVALPDGLSFDSRRVSDTSEDDEPVTAAPSASFAWPRRGEDTSDLAVIDTRAEELNAEAEDALSYQIPL